MILPDRSGGAMITEETLSALESVTDSLLHILGEIEDVDDLPDDIQITGDSDDIEYFLDEVRDLCNIATDEISDWINAKRDGSSVASYINELLESLRFSMEDVEIEGSYLLSKIETLINAAESAVKMIESDPDKDALTDRSYYVYTHVIPNTGEVFYVGKGKGRRAWSKNRQQYWHDYLKKNGGEYKVNIVEDKLTEREAEEQEGVYMKKYKDTVTNLQTYTGITVTTSLDDDGLNVSIDLE